MLRKKTYLFFFIALSFCAKAQIKNVLVEIKRIEFNLPENVAERVWKQKANLGIHLGQQHLENWVSSGAKTSQVSLEGEYDHQLSYQTKKMIWLSDLNLSYGINKAYSQQLRKTNDRIKITSTVGKKVSDNLSYSYFLSLQTWFSNTYDYVNDTHRVHRLSGFLAPLYLTTGPGILLKGRERGVLNIAPLSLKTTYINGRVNKYNKDTETFSNSDTGTLYGVSPGRRFDMQLGFYAYAYYHYKLWENIQVKNKLSLYSDYLYHPKNLNIDYTMQILFQINSRLNTQLTLQAMYDDIAYAGLQLRENFSVGVNFKLFNKDNNSQEL